MSLVGSLVFALNFSSLISAVLILKSIDGSSVLEEVAAGVLEEVAADTHLCAQLLFINFCVLNLKSIDGSSLH